MMQYIITQSEWIVRILLAGICGCVIGYERKSRLKVAGIRTHMIVAIGASLIIIISKYGFDDVVLREGYRLDPSRIASQIVSGVGFLGAGIIFVRKQMINGLTTAAGIWTTAGVGMAIGAQLYAVGIAATVLLLIGQILLHKNYKWLSFPMAEQINMEIDDDKETISYLHDSFTVSNIEILNFKSERSPHKGKLEIELLVKLPQGYDKMRLLDMFKDNDHIISIEY